MAFNLLRNLKERPDIELLVIVLNSGQLADALAHIGIEILVLDERRESFWSLLRKVGAKVKEFRPRIIHSHRYKENLMAYVASCSVRTSVALVSTQHGMPELYGAGAGWRQKLKMSANNLLLSRAFELTISVSQDIERSLMQDCGFPADRVRTIRNGILVPPLRERVERGRFVIGAAGRFVPVKDYAFMVEVAKLVCGMNADISFYLAGDGPTQGEVQEKLLQYGLEGRVVLKGFMSDLDEFYAGLDVFLNTSLHEGIPMSVLEAMARGIPVIAPSVGGLGEIIEDQKEGYLVAGRDPRDFAERCLSLFESRGQRRQMGLAARTRILQSFSIDRMGSEYFDMYGKVSGRSRVTQPWSEAV